MTTTALPPVNPVVIGWARRESGYGPERIAQRLSVAVDRVLAWEAGARAPTMRQVHNLASFLRRPVTLFFQPAPPQVAPLAAEYRRLPGVIPGKESPELRLALRQMINRRERALDLSDELGVDLPGIGLTAKHVEAPHVVAARIRTRLGINNSDQLAWKNGWQAWRHWRTATESIGVLVFQFPGVALDEVRGLALLHQPLPVIGINSKETVPEARVYTLIHELVHLALAAGADEKPALTDTHDDQTWATFEQFADATASHVILPTGMLDALLGSEKTAKVFDVAGVRRLARQVGITPLAFATRLLMDDRMSRSAYQNWRGEWAEWLQAHPPKGGGFSLPDQKALGRNGRPFVRLVFDALAQNRITATDAARYLDLRYQHFPKLTNRLIGPIDLGEGDA